MDEMKLAELIRSVIREEINGLQNEINGLQNEMNRRFDKIEDVQRETLQMLKDSRTEARSEAKQLAAIQTKQQRVIEMLSSRSVQNEADIKSLQDEVEIVKDQLPKT